MLCYCHSFCLQEFQWPDSAVFSVGPAGAGSSEALGAVPCWDLPWEPGPSAVGTSPGDRRLLLSFSAGSQQLWSLPAIVSAELARQSVAVPTGTCAQSGFSTRYCVLGTHQQQTWLVAVKPQLVRNHKRLMQKSK